MNTQANFLTGTSGYSYKDWVGPVYPEGTPAKNYLKFYSREFSFTELNFSYYRQPEPHTIERLCAVTPDEFMFSIKAHKSLTHERGEAFEYEVDKFRYGVAPLVESGKLVAVLFQFPYSFHYTPDNRKYLKRLLESFQGMPCAVEFRNSEWTKSSVFKSLENLNTGFVNVDTPPLPKLPKPSDIVTSPVACVRFHGRNSGNWWGGDNASRYDYLYSHDEIDEWVPRLESMAQKAETVVAAFNNHWKGQAVTNARMLKKKLQ